MVKLLPTLALRLLLAACGVAVGAVVALAFGARIIDVLVVPVLSALPDGRLYFTSATDPMMLAAFKGPFYGGIFLAAPWVLWQLWLLLVPERHRPKRRVALPLMALATALFYGGAAFAYGVALPWALPRMLGAAGTGLRAMLTVDAAAALVVKSMIWYGLAFELPLVGALVAIVARGSTRRVAAAASPGPHPSAPSSS